MLLLYEWLPCLFPVRVGCVAGFSHLRCLQTVPMPPLGNCFLRLSLNVSRLLLREPLCCIDMVANPLRALALLNCEGLSPTVLGFGTAPKGM